MATQSPSMHTLLKKPACTANRRLDAEGVATCITSESAERYTQSLHQSSSIERPMHSLQFGGTA